MNLGLAGVVNKMDSMGSLSNASKFWSAGDRVGLLFAIDGFEEDGFTPRIPVGHLAGHSVDLGDAYDRSFLTTTCELDPKTNKPLKPDFLYNVAGIASALLRGEYESAISEKKKLYSNNQTRLDIELGNVEEAYDDKFPAIGPLQIKAYTEVGVFKLDVNNKVQGPSVSFQRASLALSKKRANMLLSKIRTQGVHIPGTNYVYVYMSTVAGDKKEAGKVDYIEIADADKKLENLVDAQGNKVNPNFQELATQFCEGLSKTEEAILSKIYDSRPWDLGEFKSAVAQYVAGRDFYLKDSNDEYFDFVRRESNVETLRELGLVAHADEIEALLDKPQATPEQAFASGATEVTSVDETAQTLNLSSEPPVGGQDSQEVDPFAV